MIDIETLQSRLMMATDLVIHMPSIEITNKVLIVTGSSDADTIKIAKKKNASTVFVLSVLSNQRNYSTMFFYSREVNQIRISGGDGNDSITIDPAVAIPTTLVGGYGNDVIIQGGGATKIDGSAGNDILGRRADIPKYPGGVSLVNPESNVPSVNTESFAQLTLDRIETASQPTTILGGRGKDVLYAERNMLIDGGTGPDLISFLGEDPTSKFQRNTLRYDSSSLILAALGTLNVEFCEVHIEAILAANSAVFVIN